MIIIIVQYVITENLPFIVQFHKNGNTINIFITHPIDIDCSITNKPLCIAHKNLIWLPIIGHFSK